MQPDRPAERGAQPIPVFKIDAAEVEDAYQAFAALRRAACDRPSLLENDYFTALQDTAYARFLLTFEAME